MTLVTRDMNDTSDTRVMSTQVADEGNGEQVKFKYEEHDNAHLFFTPYLWTQVLLFFLYIGDFLLFLIILCLFLFSYLSTCRLS